VIVGACLAVLLTGCGATSAPPTAPTEYVVSPTPSPLKPLAPVLPEAAKADTKAGAVAFVRHYVDVLNYAQSTGETRGVTALGDADCRSCRNVARAIQAIYKPGGTISGGTWTLQDLLGTRRNKYLRGWSIAFRVAFDFQSISGSQEDRDSKGGTYVVTFQVARRNLNWKASQWSRAA